MKIDMAPIISGGHLSKPIMLTECQTVDDVLYMKVNKRMGVIQRLLGVAIKDNQQDIEKTNIIEKVVELKNEAVARAQAGPSDGGARQPLQMLKSAAGCYSNLPVKGYLVLAQTDW